MKKIIKEILGYLLVKWFFLSGRKTDQILSLTFHYPSVKMFTDTIDILQQQGYTIIPLSTLEQVLLQPESKRKLAFITIDDAWRSNLDLLPVLEKRQVPVAIFVPTESVKEGNYWWEYARVEGQDDISGIRELADFKKLPDGQRKAIIAAIKDRFPLTRSCVTIEELQTLANSSWVTIGSHTVTHPILDTCTPDQQQWELDHSRQQLSAWLNRPVEYFAYPNGDYDPTTLNLVKQSGYRLCFTDRHGTIRLPWTNRFEIPRNSLNDTGGYYENYAKLLGIWQKVFGEN